MISDVTAPCRLLHMPTFRTFRNTDPPALASLWRSRAAPSWLVQPISPDLLEQLIFAKLYFDYGGLFLAENDGRLAGFAHAGFGPNAEQRWICSDCGVICAVLVQPDAADAETAAGLIESCEKYLRDRGAKTIYGGGFASLDPFYVGLYGGAELPGILDADAAARTAFAARGYREVERFTILERELDGVELPIDRRQMQVRRQMLVEVVPDAPTRTWWEACTVGEFELTRFEAVPRVGGSPAAAAAFRSMEPSGTTTVSRSVGLLDLSVDESYRRRGLATFLLSEAFRHFLRQGITHVTVQSQQTNAAALGLFDKFGFQPREQGGVWKKD